jgi:hypothetical protein
MFVLEWWGGDLAGNIEGRNLSKWYFFLREFGVVRQWGSENNLFLYFYTGCIGLA